MTTQAANAAESGALAKGGIIPYLNVDGAMKAAAFYEKAFGASVIFAQPVDDQGRTMHVHLHLNGNSLMMSDAYPEHGHPLEKASGYTLHLQFQDDVQSHWDRVVAAGVEVVLPLQLMFWGDTYGIVKDPFGVSWSLASTPK